MEYKGKRKLVPADKVAQMTRAGAKPVEAPDHAAGPASHGAEEVNEPAGPEEPEGFFSKVGSAINRAGKAATEGAEDALTTFSKYGSLGLDDELAGLAARAGTVVQRQREADDKALSGGGESLMESWRASAPAGEEAKMEQRAKTDAAAERSPVYSAQGALAGTGLQVLAAPASAAGQIATGAVGGIGMADADTEEERLGAGLIGAGIGAIPVVGKAAGSALRAVAPKAAAGGGSLLRPATNDALREGAADLAEKFAKEGVTGVRKDIAGRVGGLLRKKQKGPASMQEQMDAMPFDGEDSPVQASDIVDEAPVARAADELPPDIAPPEPGDARVSPPLAVEPPEPLLRPRPDLRMDFEAPASPGDAPESLLRPKALEPEVITTPGPGASQPGGIYMPPLQGLDAKIMETATRLGTSDVTTIANALKMQPGQIEGNLTGLLRQFKHREAIRLASPTASQKLAESAPDMPADMGSVIRKAKETARSPIDNVSGRNIKQVAAVKQQETWRATYDGLKTPEARLAFMRQIKQETGLPDDVIRQRLKLTKGEWRRTSLDRGGSLSARPSSAPSEGPLVRKKAPVDEPSASGGEGESEALTDMEQALLDRNAADAAEAMAPATGRKLYHTSSVQNIEDIKNSGLMASKTKAQGGGETFASGDPKRHIGWVSQASAGGPTVTLRLAERGSWKVRPDPYGAGDFKIGNDIPSQDIEFFDTMTKQWRPIAEFTDEAAQFIKANAGLNANRTRDALANVDPSAAP